MPRERLDFAASQYRTVVMQTKTTPAVMIRVVMSVITVAAETARIRRLVMVAFLLVVAIIDTVPLHTYLIHAWFSGLPGDDRHG